MRTAARSRRRSPTASGIRTAIDLHRFELHKALHLALSATRAAELVVNAQLTTFLVADAPIDFAYAHDGSGTARPRRLSRAAYAAGVVTAPRVLRSEMTMVKARTPAMTASETQIGACQTSTSSILTPMNPRIAASP